MKRLTIAALAVLASSADALALEAMAAADRDLWCGSAIALVVAERPADSPIDTATLDWLESGARLLLDRGAAAYLERGYSDAVLEERRTELAADAAATLGTSIKDEPFSYEECRALFE